MYIHNYPGVANKINLFLYSEEATVFPNWKPGSIQELNPEVFSNNDTMTIDGVTKQITVDFSGINVSPRLLGDGGGIHGGNGRCDPTNPVDGCCEFGEGYDNRNNFEHCRDYGWPFCDAFWGFVFPGFPYTGAGGCKKRITPNYIAPDGKIKQPYRTIDAVDPQDGKYWNYPLLWNNGFANSTAFLVKHDGPNHGEIGGYEYLISVGHPITTRPCGMDPDTGERRRFTFNFWDNIAKTFISRKFICPCVAFSSSEPCNDCGVDGSLNSWLGTYCAGEDAALTNDQYRLWIMAPEEQPIPQHIKRYKLLKGDVPVGTPIYSLKRPNTITKEIVSLYPETEDKITSPDLTIPGSYGIRSFSPTLVSYIQSSGEGDDGIASLTVSPEGETIFVQWGDDVGQVQIQEQSQPISGTNRCNNIYDDIFFKVASYIDINTWCLPEIFHREELQNPPVLLTNRLLWFPVAIEQNDNRNRLNNRLEQLGKPKIVFYRFPNLINEGDSVNLPEINQQTAENLPLKNSPYLSRESANDIFRNTNVVGFRQQKMLQASELNEIQEKFYRKQKLIIQHVRNWLTKDNITQNPNDLFCMSENNSIFQGVRLNKSLPIEQNKISIDSTPDNQFAINIDPTYLLLKSNFRQGTLNQEFAFSSLHNNPHNSFNFYKLQNRLTIGFNIDDITENKVKIVTIGVDYGNIITCNEYSELRDNSGGSSETAPCGADRNVLIDKFTNTINFDLPFVPSQFDSPPTLIQQPFEIKSPVNNYSTRETDVPFMIAYMKKENNSVNVYYSNGLLITSIPV